MRNVICMAVLMLVLALSSLARTGADEDLLAWWKFDEEAGKAAVDSVRKIGDAIEGNFKYVDGASGRCLRFDGYTTRVVRQAERVPEMVESFAIEVWIAPQTYSWNWTGIVDQAGEEIVDKVEEGKLILKPGLFGAKYTEANLENAEGTDELKHFFMKI